MNEGERLAGGAGKWHDRRQDRTEQIGSEGGDRTHHGAGQQDGGVERTDSRWATGAMWFTLSLEGATGAMKSRDALSTAYIRPVTAPLQALKFASVPSSPNNAIDPACFCLAFKAAC